MFTVKVFSDGVACPSGIYEAEAVFPKSNNTSGSVDEIEIERPYPQSRVIVWLGPKSFGDNDAPSSQRVTVENSAGKRVEDFQYAGHVSLTPPAAGKICGTTAP